MKNPTKKNRKEISPKQKGFFLLGLFLLCVLGVIGYKVLTKPISPPEKTPSPPSIFRAETEDIARIEVLKGEELLYRVLQPAQGEYLLEGFEERELEQEQISQLFSFAGEMQTTGIIDEDLHHQEEDHLEETVAPDKKDYGLQPPSLEVRATDTEGNTWRFFFGKQVPFENLYYFQPEGAQEIYTVTKGFYENYDVLPGFLLHTPNLDIHWQRIRQVEVTHGENTATFRLEGELGGEDSLFRWKMVTPYAYPCDPQQMDTLLSGLEKIDLGIYLGPATGENKEKYELTSPSSYLTLIQEEGIMGAVGMQGVYQTTSYPAQTLTIALGKNDGDHVYYALVEEEIYLISTMSTPVFRSLDPLTYLLKRPALFPLETIETLAYEIHSTETEKKKTYQVVYDYQLLENNEPVMDEQGNPVRDLLIFQGEKQMDAGQFSLGFITLTSVNISGTLPQGYVAKAPRATINITTTQGFLRRIELAEYDVLHDSVTIDGVSVFYIRKGLMEEGLAQLEKQ
ncbi:MAG: DUF4340 domain-containing protein [Clostridiales bacterium]|nr:DUF4340 domain-containing protein [Clostridiales bacterium]